jgi:hypothetical protein
MLLKYTSTVIVLSSYTIGADVNWGVRFNTMNDSIKFAKDLCVEVSRRLDEVICHNLNMK